MTHLTVRPGSHWTAPDKLLLGLPVESEKSDPSLLNKSTGAKSLRVNTAAKETPRCSKVWGVMV